MKDISIKPNEQVTPLVEQLITAMMDEACAYDIEDDVRDRIAEVLNDFDIDYEYIDVDDDL